MKTKLIELVLECEKEGVPCERCECTPEECLEYLNDIVKGDN